MKQVGIAGHSTSHRRSSSVPERHTCNPRLAAKFADVRDAIAFFDFAYSEEMPDGDALGALGTYFGGLDERRLATARDELRSVSLLRSTSAFHATAEKAHDLIS
jgi:hypothetical protein